MVTVDREARTEEEEAGQSLRQYSILSRLRLKARVEQKEERSCLGGEGLPGRRYEGSHRKYSVLETGRPNKILEAQ